ncbi:MAG: heavy metal-binding domain-containing protein [Candidatus Eremiobacteraeota bacterium]|nr:heavy metal-binding domain-containing protein [Candidatus Eremiobacteraeota bacterium]MBV8354970.1 heavy metal-binding domain-containing protein [Candidatus Eremiobacteraeota bacterium]
MIAPENVVTFERVEGFRIVRSFGYAYGQASRPRNLLRATFRSIGAFIGLAPLEYLTDAEKARAESLSTLVARASALGANGILGLQFQVVEQSDGSTRVVAFGEAVYLDPDPAEKAAR